MSITISQPRVSAAVVLGSVALGVSGCGAGSHAPAGSLGSGAPLPGISVPGGPGVSPQEAVRTTYERFWRDTWHLDKEVAGQQKQVVDQVAVEPERSILLQGAQWHQAQGVTLYGDPVERVTDVTVRGDQATVADCQDGSKAGQADARSGQPKNVGVARNPVVATLTRGTDGVWRVSQIRYPGGEC